MDDDRADRIEAAAATVEKTRQAAEEAERHLQELRLSLLGENRYGTQDAQIQIDAAEAALTAAQVEHDRALRRFYSISETRPLIHDPDKPTWRRLLPGQDLYNDPAAAMDTDYAPYPVNDDGDDY